MTDAELIEALEALDVPKMWQPPYSGIGKTAREAAKRLTQLSEDNERLRKALQRLIYEITHLSPMEDDGSHRCKVSAEALKEARAAFAQGQKEGDDHD